MHPMPGHTLAETMEQVGILTGTDGPPATAIVDKGYRAWKLKACASYARGKGAASPGRSMINGLSAIAPAIGHLKMDG